MLNLQPAIYLCLCFIVCVLYHQFIQTIWYILEHHIQHKNNHKGNKYESSKINKKEYNKGQSYCTPKFILSFTIKETKEDRQKYFKWQWPNRGSNHQAGLHCTIGHHFWIKTTEPSLIKNVAGIHIILIKFWNKEFFEHWCVI